MSTRFWYSYMEVRMSCKIIHLMLGLILVLLLSGCTIKASPADDGYKQCEYIVKKWASSSAGSKVKEDKHALRDLLFFLHVPRTGGRTYFHCFLKKMYSNSQECPRSYDKLRFNPRKTNCRLLSTHDDYSMMSKLPKEKTSVVTILRNPVDRVFSTYEFSVEVAARFLIHPNLTSVARMAQHTRRKSSAVSTLDIWPWKHLVPWMREDLFARRDARRLRGQSHLSNDPYDMEDILMPLHEYINHPIARDIVHNGATFQIVGLTNNSYFVEAHEVRHCVLKYQSLGEYVLEVAKKKLDDMLYVGLTENHKESASMFANIVGAQVISQHTISNSTGGDVSEQSSVLSNTKSDDNGQGNNTYQTLKNVSSTGKDEVRRDNLTVGKLMEVYETCISSLRGSQSERRVNSLKLISPANFTKEARRKVPEALIREIESLNSLDMELYSYAQHIFTKQQASVMQSMVRAKSDASTFSTSTISTSTLSTSTIPTITYPSFNNPISWKLSLSITALLLVLFIFVFVNSRRRTSKVKM